MSTFESIGRFQGFLDPEFDNPHMRKWLQKLPAVPECEALSANLDYVRRVSTPGSPSPLALKSFPYPGAVRSKLAERFKHASPGKRSFDAACHLRKHGAATPRPVAWLACSQTREDYLLTECLSTACTFQEALLHHYYENPLCSDLMDLLLVAAKAVRSMHDAGFEHKNLENHNILVRRNKNGNWDMAWIIDLHHGQIYPKMTSAQRGHDNALISLPSDLRRVFFEMQCAPRELPQTFRRSEKSARTFAQLQNRSARFLHLFRTESPDERPAPSEKDIWVWDDRSRQAIPALKSRDKRKYYRKRDLLEMGSTYLRNRGPLQKAYKEIQGEAWTKEIEMEGRIGLSINLEPDRFEKERRWLNSLGPLPLLVRLYHHETESNQRFAMNAVRKLNSEGHRVTVALVQDRRALTTPSSWQAFVEKAGGGLSGFVEAFEVGHAINRVKWGIWNIPEYRQFISPFQEWSKKFPQVPLIGPAGIDFEYPRVIPMLDQWPNQSLSAFSHHLYVDRRGDPENRQSGYDTADKLALARAISRIHPACEERVIVSEVNWPLKGTGVWSPVGSPYQSPGIRHNDPSVDEETYARYMKKYLLIALCSGLADQVYWWNLAAHGFGLIDDRDENGWRPRPAFHTFKEIVEATRGATFLRREGEAGDRCYSFLKDSNEFKLS